MGNLTGQIAGRDASISRSRSHHPKKEYIFDPSDFRRLRLHETIPPRAITKAIGRIGINPRRSSAAAPGKRMAAELASSFWIYELKSTRLEACGLGSRHVVQM